MSLVFRQNSTMTRCSLSAIWFSSACFPHRLNPFSKKSVMWWTRDLRWQNVMPSAASLLSWAAWLLLERRSLNFCFLNKRLLSELTSMSLWSHVIWKKPATRFPTQSFILRNKLLQRLVVILAISIWMLAANQKHPAQCPILKRTYNQTLALTNVYQEKL